MLMPADPCHVKALLVAAVELTDLQARQAFLDRECGADGELRQQLESLLQAHDQLARALNQPLAGLATVVPAATRVQATAGEVIQKTRQLEGYAAHESVPGETPGTLLAGRYELVEELGEGGMGTVWLAEQTQPVRRKVAVKLIKAGMDSRNVLARFEAERQALAVMEHPNIARVLDAGSENGRPFFVMEYVPGVPLTRYCDEARLSIRERLALFVPVCSAVQHAHQKGILHRDLKPSNILVCQIDGRPAPRVIDFGLAKAMHQPLTEHTFSTAHGMVLGTPLYMSPEQAEPNNPDVDTRADIYALGVVLYELLTGTTPLEMQRLRETPWHEMLRLIKEEEPPRPSARLSGSRSPAVVAAQRGVEPVKLKKLVRGELDWIVMKCLEKDRDRRYETASGLARDVERYLADEVVEARPPSTTYRLRKFVRRHRGRVIAACLVVLALVGGIIGTTVGLIAAKRQEALAHQERDRANEAKADTEAFSRFLVHHVLGIPQPFGLQEGVGIDLKMSDALKGAEKKIPQAFAGRPEAEAKTRYAFGVTWASLGRYQEAEEQLRRALALYEETLGPDDLDTLASLNDLGTTLANAGKTDEGISLLERVHRVRLARNGPDGTATLITLANLAAAYRTAGRMADAIELYEQGRDACLDRVGPAHPEAVTILNNLGVTYQTAGRIPEAVQLFERVRDACVSGYGPNDPATLLALNNLATGYQSVRKVEQAIPIFEEVLPKISRAFGEDHPSTFQVAVNLAVSYQQANRLFEAARVLNEWLPRIGSRLPPGYPATLQATRTAGGVGLDLLKAGRPAEAEPLMRACLAIREKQQPDDWLTFSTKSVLGETLLGQKKYADAEPLLLQGYEGMKRREEQIPQAGRFRLAEAAERLVRLREAMGNKGKAEEWRKKVEEVKATKPPGIP
jgi:tetratricopeptide (TPR) repeat protein/predicted Ser/Thr protein kinase